MRYIPLDQLNLPAGWEVRAAKAKTEIMALNTPEERKRYLDKRNSSNIWQALKKALSDLSHSKCWYCETARHRSDDPVDHFRPKNGVAECKDHEGYWWLAFDWKNYRFCCSFCNSLHGTAGDTDAGGKGVHFPLFKEDDRARTADAVENEIPLLLDPTNASDCTLLLFVRDGRVVPQYKDDEALLYAKKANTSIAIYNLGYGPTKERRKKLFDTLKQLVHDGRQYLSDPQHDQDKSTAGYALSRTMQHLLECISDKAEYSIAARHYLEDLKGEDNWLEVLLQAS